MELFPKKYDALLGKIGAIIYSIFLIAFGIYGTTQDYFYTQSARLGRLTKLTFIGEPATYMIWGTVLLLAIPIGLVFSSKKYALSWIISCLIGSAFLFTITYYMR